MKRSFWLTIFAALGFAACSQPPKTKTSSPATSTNTLLWRVSGKNLAKPSYLFGTMHMICANDIELSENLKSAIGNADKVYLELDMDDMFQMLGAMSKMPMRDDTTLSDLLTPEEYKKVKDFFTERSSMIPFAMIEKYKPLLIGSMIMEQSANCENMIIMDQLVMAEAKDKNKDIDGLETMDYQISIFDSIPYKLQAQQLLKMVESFGKKEGDDEMRELTEAYRTQQLEKMDELTKKEDMGMQHFTDILLYNRNLNWAKKLEGLMAKKSLVVAVGAGHLPGDKGVINLLRKAGYTVEPVKNEMIRKKVREI